MVTAPQDTIKEWLGKTEFSVDEMARANEAMNQVGTSLLQYIEDAIKAPDKPKPWQVSPRYRDDDAKLQARYAFRIALVYRKVFPTGQPVA